MAVEEVYNPALVLEMGSRRHHYNCASRWMGAQMPGQFEQTCRSEASQAWPVQSIIEGAADPRSDGSAAGF